MSERTVPETEKKCITIANTVGTLMAQEGGQPMPIAVQGAVSE